MKGHKIAKTFKNILSVLLAAALLISSVPAGGSLWAADLAKYTQDGEDRWNITSDGADEPCGTTDGTDEPESAGEDPDGEAKEAQTPEISDAAADLSASKKPEIKGLKLNGVKSTAQGFDEIVLQFTAVKNGIDSTEQERVYYEVTVTGNPQKGEQLPKGSPVRPRIYYIPKKLNVNKQCKSIRVNAGDTTEPTACHYDFAVRLVSIDTQTQVPDEDEFVETALIPVRSGNTLFRTFATKEPFYETQLGFSKKAGTMYSGQKNVLFGYVKYSKKASYLHDLTAIAYAPDGSVCEGLACTFKNDNDELYLSAGEDLKPGKYKVVIYAGVGAYNTSGIPQGGSMYQSNRTVYVTLKAGIHRIDVSGLSNRAALHNRNISVSVKPKAYDASGNKSATQKFTYEILTAMPDEDHPGEFLLSAPSEKVQKFVSVDRQGKVKIKKGFYVDPQAKNNYIAVRIKGADYPGNVNSAVTYIQVVNSATIPNSFYIESIYGTVLQGDKFTINNIHGAKLIVLDKSGNNINDLVEITPKDNRDANAGLYVEQKGREAWIYARRIGTYVLTAKAKDGSGFYKELKLKVTRPVFSNCDYLLTGITSDGYVVKDENIYHMGNATIAYSAPPGAVVSYKVGPKLGNTVYYNRTWIDWDYSVEGGRLAFQDDTWMLTQTAKTAKVVFWQKSDPDNSFWLKFVNEGFDKPCTKYPYVSQYTEWNDEGYLDGPQITKTGGNLYSTGYFRSEDMTTGALKQTLHYRYDYGSVIRVSAVKLSSDAPELYVENLDKDHMTFDLSTYETDGLKAGNYKYAIAFYQKEKKATNPNVGGATTTNPDKDDTEEKMICRPTILTVTVLKAKQMTIGASYSLDPERRDKVYLNVKPADFLPNFSPQILDSNTKGRPNDISKYFELAFDRDPVTGETAVIVRIKDNVNEAQRYLLRGRKFTGYVKYSYYYGNSLIQNQTSKITIYVKKNDS